MDILNVQSLVAQGFITDIASIDPNNAYITIGVYQPGNRPAGSGNNTYPSYAIPVSEFLNGSSAVTGAQNGLNLVGTVTELGGTLIHNTDIDIAGFSMLFKNGSYPILFLDPSKQQVAIGSNNPNAMLDITAVGSGTVGLNLNTASTQDAKLHFRTNNSLTPRTQVYLENSTQTFNVYTVNSDSIFWNGNGLAQSKTLTLFTNTTAKFENNLGIGVTASSNARTHIQGIDSTSSNYALKVDNSASSPLLYVRNDGYTGVNLSTFSYRFQVGNDIDGNGLVLSTVANQPLVLLGKNTVSVPTGYLGIYDTNGNTKVALSANQYCVSDYINTGLNFGIGAIFNPSSGASAKLHVQGVDATASNYALKVDNSASSPLLYVRNDGIVSIGKTLQIQRYNYSGTQAFWMEANSIEDTEMNTLNADLIFKNKYSSGSNVESIRFTKEGIIKVADTSYISIGAYNVTTDKYGYLSSASNTTSGVGLKFEVCQPANTTGFIAMQIENTGNVGIDTTPTAKLHVQGTDSTYSNYALKVDNSASSPLLYVRNDGSLVIGDISTKYFEFNPAFDYTSIEIGGSAFSMGVNYFSLDDRYNFVQSDGYDLINGITNNFVVRDYSALNTFFKISSTGVISAPLLPISNAGLLTGDFYVDTAANILANGDKVVGWKV